MTREEKILLFKDLCARLPYHVRVKVWLEDGDTEEGPLDLQHNYGDVLLDAFYYKKITKIKPYLRPMSSMTEEEQKVFSDIESEFLETLVKKVQQIKDDNERRHLLQKAVAKRTSEMVQFYNKSHLDYNGLIEKGLALEAHDGMYNTKTE